MVCFNFCLDMRLMVNLHTVGHVGKFCEINGKSTYIWPRWKILCHLRCKFIMMLIIWVVSVLILNCVDSNAQAFFNMTEYYINIAFFYHLFSEKIESLFITCDRSIPSLAYKKIMSILSFLIILIKQKTKQKKKIKRRGSRDCLLVVRLK